MDISTTISLVSLLIAILALPMSYYVAVRQVRVGLDEQNHRSMQRACLLVADTLDEFFKVFNSAVKELTGIQAKEIPHRIKEIDPRMQEIDTFVGKTKVLERLAQAIDNLTVTGFTDLPQSLVAKLQSVRNQIALGSDTTRYSTLGVISACGNADIQAALRKGARN